MVSDERVERLWAALDMADTGVALMRQNLRRAHPSAAPEQIDALLDEWIGDRPGAQQGDCPGSLRVLSGHDDPG